MKGSILCLKRMCIVILYKLGKENVMENPFARLKASTFISKFLKSLLLFCFRVLSPLSAIPMIPVHSILFSLWKGTSTSCSL